MGVLAKARWADLDRLAAGLEAPEMRVLRAPETGMTMVRGRAGGDGRVFNLGEMTVTRCSVQDEEGRIGMAYVAGRSPAHAERAAHLDALLQDPARHAEVMEAVIRPLAALAEAGRDARARRAAATRVEFFTMVRGEG